DIKRQQGRQYFALGAQIGICWYGLALRKDASVYGIETALLAYAPIMDFSEMERLGANNFPAEFYRPRLGWFLGFRIVTDL
ncbi:MAG: hypothetical protein AAF975_06305, partial [Spirochaetota bacterium]